MSWRHIIYGDPDSAAFLFKGTGTMKDIFSFFRRISNAEKALEESECLRRAIFDETYEFIGIMTPDGTLIDANRTALEFSGVDSARVLNKPFWEGPWWEHSEALRVALKAAITKAAKGEFIRFGATHYDKDKKLHYVDFSIKPVKDKDGKVIYLIPEGRDITEHKKLEAILRFDREVIRNMDDGVLYISAINSEILFTNDRLDEMFGYGTGSLWGKYAGSLFPPVDDKTPEEVYKKIVEDLNMHRKWKGKLRNFRKDGVPFDSFITITTASSATYGRVWVCIYKELPK